MIDCSLYKVQFINLQWSSCSMSIHVLTSSRQYELCIGFIFSRAFTSMADENCRRVDRSIKTSDVCSCKNTVT